MQAQQDVVFLQNVPYGRQGPWAVNIWVKFGDLWGLDLGYMYSHWNSTGAAAFVADPTDAWFPNQVRSSRRLPSHRLQLRA